MELYAVLKEIENCFEFGNSFVTTSTIPPVKSAGISAAADLTTITLSKILNLYKIKEPFTLITDIEGMESEIFFYDAEALQKCQCIIAELENTHLYSINDQIKKLTDIGFKLEAFKKNVGVFLR